MANLLDPDWMVPGEVVPQYWPMIGEPGEPPLNMVTESQPHWEWGSRLKKLKVSCKKTYKGTFEQWPLLTEQTNCMWRKVSQRDEITTLFDPVNALWSCGRLEPPAAKHSDWDYGSSLGSLGWIRPLHHQSASLHSLPRINISPLHELRDSCLSLAIWKLRLGALPENMYFALKPKSPPVESVWKWTQSSGVKTTIGSVGTVCPQNLASSSPSESPAGRRCSVFASTVHPSWPRESHSIKHCVCVAVSRFFIGCLYFLNFCF